MGSKLFWGNFSKQFAYIALGGLICLQMLVPVVGESYIVLSNPGDADKLYQGTNDKDVVEKALTMGMKTYEEKRPALKDYFEGFSRILEDDYQGAYKAFQSSAEKALEDNDKDTASHAELRLMQLAAIYGDIPQLLKGSKKLQDISIQTEDKWDDILANYGFALAYYFQVDDEQSNRYLSQVAKLALEDNNLEMQGAYWLQKGHMYYSYEAYEQAYEYFLKAESILKLVPSGDPFEDLYLDTRLMLLQTEADLDNDRKKYSDIEDDLYALLAENQNKLNKNTLLYSIYYAKGKIEETYENPKESLEAYKTAKMYLTQIVHIDNGIDPFQDIDSDLANAYYQNNAFYEAASVYKSLEDAGRSAKSIEVSNEISTVLRNFGAIEFEQEIDVLSALREAQDDRIQKQGIIIILAVGLIGALAILAGITRREMARIKALQVEIYQRSITDSLTQIPNRGQILQFFEENVKREGVVALLDVDNFKKINDTYGHLFGDQVLRKIAQTIKESIREQDEAGRYGGEEFLIVIQESDVQKALKIVERVRTSIEAIQWNVEGLVTTVSIGMVSQKNGNSDEVLTEADRLLYMAKKTGKNRVVCRGFNDMELSM